MSGKEKEVVEIYIAEWIKPSGKTVITIFFSKLEAEAFQQKHAQCPIHIWKM